MIPLIATYSKGIITITKQYVSLVVNEVGLGGDLVRGITYVRVRAKSNEVQK